MRDYCPFKFFDTDILIYHRMQQVLELNRYIYICWVYILSGIRIRKQTDTQVHKGSNYILLIFINIRNINKCKQTSAFRDGKPKKWKFKWKPKKKTKFLFTYIYTSSQTSLYTLSLHSLKPFRLVNTHILYHILWINMKIVESWKKNEKI